VVRGYTIETFHQKEKLKDTKGVIRRRNSKVRQCNGQKKTDKKTNTSPVIRFIGHRWGQDCVYVNGTYPW